MRPDRCAHCGDKLNGLGVIVTMNPYTGEARGLPVCRPMGQTEATAHLKPYDCWSLVKKRGYELASFQRSLDLALVLQSDFFDVELDDALEAIYRDYAGTAEG